MQNNVMSYRNMKSLRQVDFFSTIIYSLRISAVSNTMIIQLAKKLNSQNAIERHEEQEEDGDIYDLLTRTPEMWKMK